MRHSLTPSPIQSSKDDLCVSDCGKQETVRLGDNGVEPNSATREKRARMLELELREYRCPGLAPT